MTIELWAMVGIFIGMALIYGIWAIRFAAWHQRSRPDPDESTVPHLKSIDLGKKDS